MTLVSIENQMKWRDGKVSEAEGRIGKNERKNEYSKSNF
jgi:hypothetical protein